MFHFISKTSPYTKIAELGKMAAPFIAGILFAGLMRNIGPYKRVILEETKHYKISGLRCDDYFCFGVLKYNMDYTKTGAVVPVSEVHFNRVDVEVYPYYHSSDYQYKVF
jgi:hypothetical protein